MDEVEQYKSTSGDEEDDDRNGSLKGWLRPRIRVRIISKSFKSGRYYNEKCSIQDIACMGECIVKLSNGDVLDGRSCRPGTLLNNLMVCNIGVKERHLETYIPSVGQTVMVVHHSDRTVLNHTGKLLERNHKTEKAIVQMDQTYDIVV